MFHLNFSGCIISSCCEGFPSKAPESFSSCSLAAPLQGTSGINPNSQATERASTLKGDECISWTQENSIQQKPWDDWNGCFVSSLYLWMIGDWMIWMLCDLSLIELWIIVVSLDLFRLFRDSSGANQFAVWKKNTAIMKYIVGNDVRDAFALVLLGGSNISLALQLRNHKKSIMTKKHLRSSHHF